MTGLEKFSWDGIKSTGRVGGVKNCISNLVSGSRLEREKGRGSDRWRMMERLSRPKDGWIEGRA
jgi:hypothetical protein